MTDLSRLFAQLYPEMPEELQGIDLFDETPVCIRPTRDDLADAGLTRAEWNEALAMPDWMDAIDRLLNQKNQNERDDDV